MAISSSRCSRRPTGPWRSCPAGAPPPRASPKPSIGDGAGRKTVVAYAISGISNSPFAVWTTEDGRFFANIGALSLLPEGYEGALSQLNKAQDEALARQSPKVAHQFLKAPQGAVAFAHVRLYDADEAVFRQTRRWSSPRA